jgi:hypothetical protein
MKEARVGGYIREVQAVIGAYQHAFIYRWEELIHLINGRNNCGCLKNFLEFYF